MPDRDRRRHAPTALLVATFVLPLVALVPRAFADAWRAPALVPQAWGLRGVRAAFTSGAEVEAALRNSTLVGLGTVAVALLLAWPAGRAMVRLSPARRAAVFVLLLAPLLVPAYATGTGLVPWLLRLGLADTLLGVGAAHLLYVLPYVLLALLPAFGKGIDDLQDAARACGAGRWQALRWVVLPAVAPAVATATLLGFVVSWSQVGTSLAAGGGLPMLPVIALPFTRSDPQVAAVLNLVLLLPPLAVLTWQSRASTSSARQAA